MSRETPSLIHPTYRYLDRAVRLAGLTLVQWTQLVGAGLGAWVLARLLPFSTTYDLSIALSVTGMPVAASLAAGADSVHPMSQLRAVRRWHGQRAIYLPDVAAGAVSGYRLTSEAPLRRTQPPTMTSLEQLWD
jgi:hypothetical protein